MRVGARPAGRVRAALVLMLLVSAGAMGLACGSDDATESSSPEATTYVGKVTGTNAYIGVIAEGEKVLAYLCDNAEHFDDWFTGRIDGGEANLESENGVELAVHVESDRATGTVRTKEGVEWVFTGRPARGEAGVYRTLPSDTDHDGGWVVLSRDDFRGSLDGLVAIIKLAERRQEGGGGGGGPTTRPPRTIASGGTHAVTSGGVPVPVEQATSP